MRALTRPRVLFEVLSPSTRATDYAEKLAEYQAMPSVETIAFIDPVAQTVESWTREAANAWLNVKRPTGAALELASPALSIPADELFARD